MLNISLSNQEAHFFFGISFLMLDKMGVKIVIEILDPGF